MRRINLIQSKQRIKSKLPTSENSQDNYIINNPQYLKNIVRTYNLQENHTDVYDP